MPYTIGGQEYQHALVDLQAVSTGAPYKFSKFKAVKFKDAAKKSAVTDSQGQIVSYTIGKQETDASIKMLTSEWFNWRDWLLQQAAIITAQNQGNKIGYGQVASDLTVQFGNTLVSLKKRKLLGVMVNEEAMESDDNQSALEIEVPLFLLAVTDENGNRLIEYRKQG